MPGAVQSRRTIFAESSLAMSIPRSVSRIESEISPRSFSRLSERLSDVRAAFALSGPAVATNVEAARDDIPTFRRARIALGSDTPPNIGRATQSHQVESKPAIGPEKLAGPMTGRSIEE
jgi:hypothetical protein